MSKVPAAAGNHKCFQLHSSIKYICTHRRYGSLHDFFAERETGIVQNNKITNLYDSTFVKMYKYGIEIVRVWISVENKRNLLFAVQHGGASWWPGAGYRPPAPHHLRRDWSQEPPRQSFIRTPLHRTRPHSHSPRVPYTLINTLLWCKSCIYFLFRIISFQSRNAKNFIKIVQRFVNMFRVERWMASQKVVCPGELSGANIKTGAQCV